MTTLDQRTHPNASMALRANEAPPDRRQDSIPRSFRLARVPDGAGRHLRRLQARTLVQGTLVLLILPLDATAPFWLRVALAAGVTVATGAALWQYFGVLKLRRNAPATLRLDEDALRILGSAGESVLVLDYDRILSLEPQGWRSFRALFILFTGGGPLQLREGLFASPEEAEDLSEALRGRIALLPNAARQLRSIDERGEVGQLVLRRVPTLSLGFTALLCAAFGAQTLLPDDAQIQLLGEVASSGADLLRGSVLRLLSPAFLHAGGWHLAGNAIGLLLIGGLLEPVFGRARWLAVIGLSSIAGFLASSLWDPSQYSIGASGGAMGAMGALLTLNVTRRGELSARLLFPPSSLACFIVLLVAAERWPPNIDHAAHLASFTAGCAICALSVRRVPLARVAARTPPALATLAWLLAAAYMLALVDVLYAAARLS